MSGESRAAVEAWESLFRAQSVLFQQFSASPIWHGRSTREYDVLYQLGKAESGGMRQRDLTEKLYISQPSLSRLIERLVLEGLIERRPDPNDGRGALLELSESGVALQRAIGAGHAADIARTMRHALSDDELQTLRLLTDKLVGGAGERAPGPESAEFAAQAPEATVASVQATHNTSRTRTTQRGKAA